MKELRNDWTLTEVEALFTLPFNDLLLQAHTIHRENFDPNQVQVRQKKPCNCTAFLS
jgi:biotin synthase